MQFLSIFSTFKGIVSLFHYRMKVFKLFKLYRVGKGPSFPLIPHFGTKI